MINLISVLYNYLLLQPIVDCRRELYAEHNETGRVSRIHKDQNCDMLLY